MIFSRESLEELRQKIDLIEVLSAHLRLVRTGANYKAICPFHEEKTPSFVVQRGQSHYHCFGCGAHGDAIQFLMNFSQMTFAEAVEYLAERFQVILEQDTQKKSNEPNKALMRNCLDQACQFYHFLLLKTEEGKKALHYLYQRGIDLDFIQHFQIGYSLRHTFALQKFLRENHFNLQVMQEVGLVSQKGSSYRDFFQERIMFPICDAMGHVIGFSARKIEESAFGPKYINTQETFLFKKSRVLFGLSHSRRRIAKEKKVLIVEGQIDALRLIYAGLNFTVASLGTAFGEGQVSELIKLGVKKVYIGFDADKAGKEAAAKVGNLFQKEGIEVFVLNLPEDSDPDEIIKEKGPDSFLEYVKNSKEYLPFLIDYKKQSLSMDSPVQKKDLVESIAGQIKTWDHPLMVHESLKKLAKLTATPEHILSPETKNIAVEIRKTASVNQKLHIDPDRILEADLLRWLYLMGTQSQEITSLVFEHLKVEDFKIRICQRLFSEFKKHLEKNDSCDLIQIAIDLDDPEDQLFLSEILQKKVDRTRFKEGVIQTIQKILDRNWIERKETIKQKIYKGNCSEEEVVALAKEFDEMNKNRPTVHEL